MPRYQTDEERLTARRESRKRWKEKNKEKQGEYVNKYKRKRPGKLWEPSFVAIDGEGIDYNGKQRYSLFYASCFEDSITSRYGLSTLAILRYLTLKPVHRSAFVGFGLSYDFENILADVPNEDYIRLLEGEEILFYGYKLRYIPRKMLTIRKPYQKKDLKTGDKKLAWYDVTIQDSLGFFQSSFEEALKKWNVEAPPIIKEYKAKRGGFTWDDLSNIIDYNKAECTLLVELMHKLYDAIVEAFHQVGLHPKLSKRTWYGSGAIANLVLNATEWKSEHPDLTSNDEGWIRHFPSLSEDHKLFYNHMYPFSFAYYGGRIEPCANGELTNLYDYDVNSAYPYALSLLPRWNASDLVPYRPDQDRLDQGRRMGMYFIEWAFPEDWNTYPLPFRSKNGNVFFPRQGSGWYMSPEVEAMYETLTKAEWGRHVRILDGYVLAGTEGAGSALQRLPEEKLSTTAKLVSRTAAVRLEAKQKGLSYEKALKLILNSLYGKTIQQVGSHKHFSDFAAAWTTSVCRALIWRAIAPEREHDTIVSIMTDGIMSRKPLDVPLGHELGQFEMEEIRYLAQFMSGIYYYENNQGKSVQRFRGLGKNFDVAMGLSTLRGEAEFYSEFQVFVSRTLALYQPNVYGDKLYQFVPIQHTKEDGSVVEGKAVSFDLSSKRWTPNDFLLHQQPYRFYPPKENPWIESYPFKLRFDRDEEIEEILATMDHHQMNDVDEDLIAFRFDSLYNKRMTQEEYEEQERLMADKEQKRFKKAFLDRIVSHGGIHMQKGMKWHTEWTESLSRSTRQKIGRKLGIPLDEMASTLDLSVVNLLEKLSTY